jgi:lipoprotein-anchoring transpeptidase ErfK/SrfK
MAGLDAAAADAGAPERTAGVYARRRRQSARARAMYLGSTLYRIHGSNDPDSIGQAESSGCFRMTNDDVKDLYERVAVGTTVIVR